ncbi:MAG: hypothetical protein BRD50_05695 [Bacteroidetes bacterium SW_11_45_7]|nr:MAG: hypothetical protein BRD50_05695 [Bacteroidetes bacterium SW_11_45_7]
MKKLLLSLSFFLLFVISLSAREGMETSVNVSLMGGPGIHNFTNLEAHLKQQDVMGRDVNFTSVGFETGGYVGGMVRGVFMKNLLVGLSVHGLFIPKKSADRAALVMRQRGGHVNIGYTFLNRYLMMSSVYGGLGYDRLDFELTNKTDTEDLNFFPDQPIPPQSTETYSLEGISYELGVSIKRHYPFAKNKSEGFSLLFGADLGARLMADPDGWAIDSQDGPPYDTQLGAYLRLTLGVAYYNKD